MCGYLYVQAYVFVHNYCLNFYIHYTVEIQSSVLYQLTLIPSPSARLINPLGHEVSGETVFKLLGVLKRVVSLCVGHAATLKPTVEHFRHSVQVALATARRDRQNINAETQVTARGNYKYISVS